MAIWDKWNEEKARQGQEYGEALAVGLFDTRLISVFSKGFIAVGTRPPERLLDIQGDVDVNKKTGIGRTAAFVLTGGISLATPSQRGNLYLTITTESTVHALVDTEPTTKAIQAMHKIVATGKAVIKQSEQRPVVSHSSPAPESDLASQH